MARAPVRRREGRDQIRDRAGVRRSPIAIQIFARDADHVRRIVQQPLGALRPFDDDGRHSLRLRGRHHSRLPRRREADQLPRLRAQATRLHAGPPSQRLHNVLGRATQMQFGKPSREQAGLQRADIGSGLNPKSHDCRR